MAYILNIETATKNCSVAVAKNGRVLSCRELATDGYAHAEKLHVFIEESLAASGIKYSDLSAVAVSKGPGSYTGLRIGVSAAKGFCLALGIPLIAVDTLQILAFKADVNEGVIVPMLDARRMEVYSAIFDTNHEPLTQVKAEIITAESFSEIDAKMHIIGDCQPKIQTVLTDPKFVYHDDIIYPSANEMAPISFEKFTAKQFDDVAYFEPFYLKDFIAGKS
jgi:tRNA threonylcarbamoyladenosine biosynthesis protein TsaB